MVAEGYDDLMNDPLMTMLHIRNLMDVDRTKYDAVMTRYDSNMDRGSQPQTQRSSEWSCFGVFRCFIDYGLDFIFSSQLARYLISFLVSRLTSFECIFRSCHHVLPN